MKKPRQLKDTMKRRTISGNMMTTATWINIMKKSRAITGRMRMKNMARSMLRFDTRITRQRTSRLFFVYYILCALGKTPSCTTFDL